MGAMNPSQRQWVKVTTKNDQIVVSEPLSMEQAILAIDSKPEHAYYVERMLRCPSHARRGAMVGDKHYQFLCVS